MQMICRLLCSVIIAKNPTHALPGATSAKTMDRDLAGTGEQDCLGGAQVRDDLQVDGELPWLLVWQERDLSTLTGTVKQEGRGGEQLGEVWQVDGRDEVSCFLVSQEEDLSTLPDSGPPLYKSPSPPMQI